MSYKISVYSRWVRNTSSPSEFPPGKERSSGEAYGIIGSGNHNVAAATGGFVGNGYNNKVLSGYFSFIGNGANNTINSAYSAILGGKGNTIPAGFNYAGVFGCNVTANNSCTFHANNFMAQNMPTSNPGIPGVFWVDTSTGIIHLS